MGRLGRRLPLGRRDGLGGSFPVLQSARPEYDRFGVAQRWRRYALSYQRGGGGRRLAEFNAGDAHQPRQRADLERGAVDRSRTCEATSGDCRNDPDAEWLAGTGLRCRTGRESTIAGIHAGIVELADGRLMALGRGNSLPDAEGPGRSFSKWTPCTPSPGGIWLRPKRRTT